MFFIGQNGARIVESVLQGKMASTLTQGSWTDMGNFKDISLVNFLSSVLRNEILSPLSFVQVTFSVKRKSTSLSTVCRSLVSKEPSGLLF